MFLKKWKLLVKKLYIPEWTMKAITLTSTIPIVTFIFLRLAEHYILHMFTLFSQKRFRNKILLHNHWLNKKDLETLVGNFPFQNIVWDNLIRPKLHKCKNIYINKFPYYAWNILTLMNCNLLVGLTYMFKEIF